MSEAILSQAVSPTSHAETWPDIATKTSVFPRDLVLEMVVKLSLSIPGNIVEFGVAQGQSTRVIRRVLSEHEKKYLAAKPKQIYACDSFEGLQEKFENAEVGAFACDVPEINGVNIVQGFFDTSLTEDLAREVGPVALASLDADLYSSTLCALNWLTPLLSSGSLLLFDEFLGEEESEKRAFEHWSRETGLQAVKIAEFAREPSGWGTRADARTLFQVVGTEDLNRIARRPEFRSHVRDMLSGNPALLGLVKKIMKVTGVR